MRCWDLRWIFAYFPLNIILSSHQSTGNDLCLMSVKKASLEPRKSLVKVNIYRLEIDKRLASTTAEPPLQFQGDKKI